MTREVSTRAAALADWCRVALADLAAQRERIDALNVFPVADADTGTNLVVTMEAVVRAAEDLSAPEDPGEHPPPGGAAGVELGGALRLLARAAIVGAHGNSGVILAQLLHGAATELGGVTRFGGTDLARALAAASAAAYAAVDRPVEGTILSVARAASTAAAGLAGAPPEEVCAAAVIAAREALAAGPERLPALREAGVVDAGGYGLVVLLEALHDVLSGRRGPGDPPSPALILDPPSGGRAAATGPAGPAYEVGYLLDAEDTEIPRLRSVLAPLGDSLVVTGGDGLWNVHIHVDEPGPAIEAGIVAGRPHRIRVTHLDPDSRGHVRERALVAVAAGPGLAELFADAGATSLDGPVTPDRLLAAVLGTRAAEVVVLPNDRDGIESAERAAAKARARGVRVAVVPTVAQVQGLAACAVHNGSLPFDTDVVAMTTAAGHTRHGAVTVAREDLLTTAGACRRGDVLGVVDGDIALIGSGIEQVGRQVLHRLLAGGGELVTVVTGEGCGGSAAEPLLAELRQGRPELEVVTYDGGQAGYPLLIGVE